MDPDDDYGASWNPYTEQSSGLKPAVVEVDDNLSEELMRFGITKEMQGQEAEEKWRSLAKRIENEEEPLHGLSERDDEYRGRSELVEYFHLVACSSSVLEST